MPPYVWRGVLHVTTVGDSLIACGFNVRSQIIWAKDRLVLMLDKFLAYPSPAITEVLVMIGNSTG